VGARTDVRHDQHEGPVKADRDRCCAMHISTLMAESRHSLHRQTELDNLKKADARGCGPVSPMCKRSEGPLSANFVEKHRVAGAESGVPN